MATQEVPENREMDDITNLAQKVFGIDLLREMILNLAIRGDKGQVCGSNVSSLCLVQKSWLETIGKLLQKSKEPLFNLVLTKDNSLIENVGEDGKLLNRFLDALATKPSLPTFSVRILERVFRQETHSCLSKILVNFGAGLVQLKLHIPQHGGSLNFIFPNFSLPSLRTLLLKLSAVKLPGTASTNNVSSFINSLLNAAPALTHFVIPLGSHHDVRNNPLAFQLFTLPPSITTLVLSCPITSEHLELLVKSDLPKLTSLTLSIPGAEAYPDGLLFRILDKCRTTLVKLVLVLGGNPNRNGRRTITLLRFPVMEKLHEFYNLSIQCEMEAGISSLERFLPKLSRLALVNQTPEMFRKWTQNSNFKSDCLALQLANENVRFNHPDFMASVNLEMMKSLHLAFPNVRELIVTVSGSQVCGLKYLFLEMKTLSYLRIVVVGSTVGLDCDFWEALLIGVPSDFVKGYRKSVYFWLDAQLTSPSDPSIINLQELEYFSLETHRGCRHDESSADSLISDLTFLLALLKMPKLKNLHLKGKFKASDEMAKRWKNQGRKLVYYSSAP